MCVCVCVCGWVRDGLNGQGAREMRCAGEAVAGEMRCAHGPAHPTGRIALWSWFSVCLSTHTRTHTHTHTHTRMRTVVSVALTCVSFTGHTRCVCHPPAPPPHPHAYTHSVPRSAKALSKYTDMVDARCRDMNRQLADATDAARLTLKQAELPDLLDALDGSSTAAVPEALLREIKEVSSIGGTQHLREARTTATHLFLRMCCLDNLHNLCLG